MGNPQDEVTDDQGHVSSVQTPLVPDALPPVLQCPPNRAVEADRPCGARVEFMRDMQLPDRVMLSEPTLRIKTWAYVVWQTRGAAGLQFVKT